MTQPKLPVLLAVAGVACLIATPPANAWKPVTHAYLAQLALDDALDNGGKVTIYAVDYASGQILKDASGKKKVIGTYQCDNGLLAAIRQNRRQYMAGVCGPDAFPDIATGQLLIHPAGGDGNYGGKVNDRDVDLHGPGPDPWMRFLYDQSFKGGKYTTDANKAFTMGFLAHAAGDMFAHTYINNYAGGEFNFHYTENGQPRLSGNAVRHFIMEGYIGERTPEFRYRDDYNISLDNGVSSFVYDTMVRNAPGSILAQANLLSGDDKNKSLPYLMASLRQTLDDRITAYYKMGDVAQKAYSVSHPLWITYQEGWRRDIDEGMTAFPEFSRTLAQPIFFFPRDQTANMDGKGGVKEIIGAYYSDHLRYMLGEPHWVAAATDMVAAVTKDVLDALGITLLRDLIATIKKDAADFLCESAFGMSYDECKHYLTDPTTLFDGVLNSAVQNGAAINRGAMDTQLHLQPGGKFGYFDVEQFPAAYNTVTMIKLSLLPPGELRRLMTDLNGGEAVSVPADQGVADNIVMGYTKSLDAANQWKANAPRMLLARNGVFYRSIFMAFPGEAPYPSVTNLSVVSNQASGDPTFTASFGVDRSDPFGTEVGTDAVLDGDNVAVPLDADFVALPGGATTATFRGQLPGVTRPTVLHIIATNGNRAEATITVNPAKLAGLFVNRTGGYSGGGAQYTYTQPKDVSIAVGLDANAPLGGATVTLNSAQPSLLPVPANVVVGNDTATATFKPVFAEAAPMDATVAVTATYNGVSKTITFKKGGGGASMTVMTQLLPESYAQSARMRPSVAQRNLRDTRGNSAMTGLRGVRQ